MHWLAAVLLLPAPAAAQGDPSARLLDVLPSPVSELVLQRVEEARARDLPAEALASLALEGVAKGRGPQEVLAAVEGLARDMGRAHAALEGGGRVPREGEIEAAAMAMRMGVDGAEISELARSQPSGRTLEVPLLVLGRLAERGLPSDRALGAVRDRLGEGADDADLLADVAGPGPGASLGWGLGAAMAGPRVGPSIPAPGVPVPVGPPTGIARPGRGRGRGGGGPPPG